MNYKSGDYMWNSKNRRKYLLQYHVIFVCKYKKKLFIKNIDEDVKQYSKEICNKLNVKIKAIESDRDHIHYMLETDTIHSISKIVKNMKSYITYHIWKSHEKILSQHFWKEKTFFTDGYFVCSVGNVSEKMLKEYIDHQG